MINTFLLFLDLLVWSIETYNYDLINAVTFTEGDKELFENVS